MSDKYGVGQDDYCYPESSVLRNKLNIHDESSLSQAEKQLSAVAAQSLSYSPAPYSLDYLKHIHRMLFTDIYDWAGELRTVGISKQQTRFCQPEYMVREATKIFTLMASARWFEDQSREHLVTSVADAYSELNVVHPFREGNGRGQRILFEHLIINAGFEISWWGITAAEWIDANIAAFYGDLKPMERVFDLCRGQSIKLD
jgi:cell filamentation protein